MMILFKLKLSEKTRAQMLTSPELGSRQNLITAMDNQVAAVNADQTGKLGSVRANQLEPRN